MEQLVRNALTSELVQRAATRDHWRESYVGAVQPDGTVLEGYVDLLYREDDGSLVVIDYKTDQVPADALPARIAYYQPQVAAYVDIVGHAAGRSTIGHLEFVGAPDSEPR